MGCRHNAVPVKDAFSWTTMRGLAATSRLEERPCGAEIPLDEAGEALFMRGDGRLVFRSGIVLFVEPEHRPR